MSELRKLFSDFGLDRVAVQLENAAKPSLRFAAIEPSQEAVSRLGGRPNLPAGLDWPVSADGPLAFLAQIDLASLPANQELGLPPSGSLYFFYDGHGNPTKPADREMFRVLYSERALAKSRPRTYPKDLARELRFKGLHYAVARKELSFPWPEDTVIEQLELSREELQAFGKFSDQWISAPGEPQGLHRMGGYPNYVQHDPKFEAHLKVLDLWSGIWVKHPGENYFVESNRRYSELKSQLKPESSAWELLLQLDSEEGTDLMWGDMGRLYFLIQKADLQNRKFEKTWLMWDCY